MEHSDHKEEVSKGPHHGKYFEKDGFGIEVTIYEPDIPPQSRVYVCENNSPVDPSKVQLKTELHRIDRIDVINYTKQDDYLLGDIVVEEPHSFDVKLRATFKGKDYDFEYSSYEGRTLLSEEAIESTGIEIEMAGPQKISTALSASGKIIPNQLMLTSLSARFPGIVREIKKFPGKHVEKGEVIATIEANDSLQIYNIVAPRDGEILNLTYSPGELVSSHESVVTVGDLSSVWVEIMAPKNDFSKIKLGQKIKVKPGEEEDDWLEGQIIYLSAIADEDTQTRIVRAEIPNPKRKLTPGLFVDTKIFIQERDVPVVIKTEALQKFRDWDVVFKRNKDKFEIAILSLGEQDGELIEVIEGLTAGTEYVTKNSFVVKADVMKSGASHDH